MTVRERLQAAGLLAAFALGSQTVLAQPRAVVEGYVWSDISPVCALVLANGQSIFSCNPDGPFELQNVPVDERGEITIQIFAAGFAPYTQSLEPSGSVPSVSLPQVDMRRVVNGKQLKVDAFLEASATNARRIVRGTVRSGSTPVCALVLANGQKMFSCNENLGMFSLDVPVDQNGDVTIQVFAAGFQPFTERASNPAGSGNIDPGEFIDAEADLGGPGNPVSVGDFVDAESEVGGPGNPVSVGDFVDAESEVGGPGNPVNVGEFVDAD